MRIGTRSLLFGVHQFAIHPVILFVAWCKLYGFPRDPRLWVCFVVHDWGYWSKPDMDGEIGETHPTTGAAIVGWLFDRKDGTYWHDFVLYHSRFMAKKNGARCSRLCVADKYAVAIMPDWLYLFLGNLSGEIHEYMLGQKGRTPAVNGDQRRWHQDIKKYLLAWVEEHKDGKFDDWTGRIARPEDID